MAAVDINCGCLHMYWRGRNGEKRLNVSVENAGREGSWGKLVEPAYGCRWRERAFYLFIFWLQSR